MPTSADEQGVRKQQRHVKMKFAIFLSAMVLTLGSFISLLALQSSVHIVDGLGVTSAAASYITSAMFAITFAPVFLRLLGLKWTLACAYCMYFLYTCTNFYPNVYLLTVGGVFAGMAEAASTPCHLTYCVSYGRRYAKIRNKARDGHNAQFLGYFYSALFFAMVLSNTLTYCVLYVGRSPTDSWSNATGQVNGSALQQARDLSVCGPNDCQDPNATQRNLVQYVPPQTTFYVLVGVFGVMMLAAIVIQAVLVEAPDSFSEDSRDSGPGLEFSNRFATEEDVNGECGVSTLSDRVGDQSDNEGVAEGKIARSETGSDSSCTKYADEGYVRQGLESLKATLRQMFRPKQLLIVPISFYTGAMQSFVYVEMPRAYASCILGVEQVGLCTLAYSAADAVASFLVGKLSPKFGNYISLVIGMVLDIGTSLACLLWVPNPATYWVVYCLFAMLGITDAIRLTMTPDVHGRFFPENQEKAMVVWSFCFFSGYALQFGWSTALCVRYKIYIQLAFLAFSMAAYSISEILHRKDG